jgi:hypothetical protein
MNNNNRNHQSDSTTISSRDLLEMVAETIIDKARFGSRTDSILARYEDVPTLFPSADELTEKGADIVHIGNALEAGLDPVAFGKAIELGLDLKAFSAAFECGGLQVEHFAGMVESLDMETLNGALEQVVEVIEEHTQFPNPTDRVLHRLGELSLA